MKELALAIVEYLKLVVMRRSPASIYVWGGLGAVGAAYPAGLFIEFAFSYGFLGGQIGISGQQSLPSLISWILLISGVGSFLYGLIVVQPRHQRKLDKFAEKKRIVVVDHRGLAFAVNKTVSEFIPPEFIGRPEEISINQTPYVSGNNRVDNPKKSLGEILHIRRDIDERVKTVDKKDVTVIYGGLASVPFTFLTGYLIDDDNDVEVMDWDRFKGKWLHIKPKGGEARDAVISGLTEAETAEEVVVAVSVSYKADLAALEKAFPGLPIVHMDSRDYQPNNHWDQNQQHRWSEQFVSLIRALGSAKKIHLTIAAQNSVVFTLGRNHDRRCSPALYIYQYERDENPAYPWAVEIPREGNSAHIIINDRA